MASNTHDSSSFLSPTSESNVFMWPDFGAVTKFQHQGTPGQITSVHSANPNFNQVQYGDTNQFVPGHRSVNIHGQVPGNKQDSLPVVSESATNVRNSLYSNSLYQSGRLIFDATKHQFVRHGDNGSRVLSPSIKDQRSYRDNETPQTGTSGTVLGVGTLFTENERRYVHTDSHQTDLCKSSTQFRCGEESGSDKNVTKEPCSIFSPSSWLRTNTGLFKTMQQGSDDRVETETCVEGVCSSLEQGNESCVNKNNAEVNISTTAKLSPALLSSIQGAIDREETICIDVTATPAVNKADQSENHKGLPISGLETKSHTQTESKSPEIALEMCEVVRVSSDGHSAKDQREMLAETGLKPVETDRKLIEADFKAGAEDEQGGKTPLKGNCEREASSSTVDGLKLKIKLFPSPIRSSCKNVYEADGTMQSSKGAGRHHQCADCNKVFGRTEHFKRHMEKHNMVPKIFPCMDCDKSFGRSEHLKRHVRTHSGERPFSCSSCDRAFTRMEHLRRHLLIHSGEKPHTCSLCEKAFTRSEHLRNHMNTHFKNSQPLF